ncbi:TetR/AcrR family transcriptional regulator [Paenibacillus sp. Marseille-Q4541]|uniref:TetR/AcrR family transcriptional regulator n=1 Tax=Paenibacillus sp. Marseille-Q4541 TaxID=2831522 RepID=UPI001BACBAE9|nr:TetR/AcrR family transcriptional regulator [Paenibacillus sp. Marseille-Q4541]
MYERILEAAIEEINMKGLKFTMSDLASRLGVSKRTLYEHFSSKEKIVATIVSRILKEIVVKEERIYQDTTLGTIDKLKEILAIMPQKSVVVDPRFLEELKRYHPKEWKRITKFLDDEWNYVKQVLEEGIENGSIRPINVTLLIKMMTVLLRELLDHRFLLANHITTDEGIHSLIDTIMNGIVSENNK